MRVARKFLHFFTFSCISCLGGKVDASHGRSEDIWWGCTWTLEPTWDTTVTLLAGAAEAAAGVLLRGVGGTPAGLARGIPPVVITV